MVVPTKAGWTMKKKYMSRLTDAEREMLMGLLKKQRVAAQKVRRARILLKADADGPNWTDAKIAEAFDCRTRSVESLRERLVTEGFEVAVHGRPKSCVRGKVLDGEQEAKIIALRLRAPPKRVSNLHIRFPPGRGCGL